MLEIKSNSEIMMMKQSGEMLASVMAVLANNIDVGITTNELDAIAYSEIKKLKSIPSFLNYGGFPKSICASVNDEVIHGIPSKRKLNDGDIIGIDIGLVFKDYHSDMARTFGVGNVSLDDRKLMDVAKECFFKGLEFVKIGNRMGDLAFAIQDTVEKNGFSVVREFTGHGIGRKLHEDPEVPNYGTKGRGLRLCEGMVIAIEPMINAGKKSIRILADDWTVVTADGSKSAHYENTVAITKDGPLILTGFEV